MERGDSLGLTLLPGTRALLRTHARELPQRDDLCGAFCAALALRAAGIAERGGQPLDQDAVALAAGSVVSREPDTSSLPAGERGRRDYRIEPPLIDDASVSGTTAAGVAQAVEGLSGGRLSAIPYGGPWSEGALDGLFESVTGLERPVTLIANLATRHLWGAAPSAAALLDYLLEGAEDGPPADWDVGHFVCVIGRIRGPGGTLYCVADTYRSLGRGGVHLQPREALVPALARAGMAPGGMIVVASSDDAPAVRSSAERLGLLEGLWDNGSLIAETLR